MKIQTSICADCKHFQHECNAPANEEDYVGCEEYCTHDNKKIRVNFFEEDEILKCEGFENN